MKFPLYSALAFAAGALLTFSAASAQSVTFTQTMDIGSRGSEVAALQTFLSTQTSYYPEGLVTGYYGPLTAAAIMRFQCAEEIVCSGSAATTGYGRVGPMTLAQLNLVASGKTGADVSAPVISPTSVTVGSTTATVHFGTSKAAQGKVFYGLSLTLYEGEPAAISGSSAMTDANFRVAHDVTITGLAPSTTYQYVVQATDASGNISLTWPATFTTTH